jgi:hypothetical protein
MVIIILVYTYPTTFFTSTLCLRLKKLFLFFLIVFGLLFIVTAAQNAVLLGT